jgi:HEAT repeat protein
MLMVMALLLPLPGGEAFADETPAYRNIAPTSGIAFRHIQAANHVDSLPDVMGSGVCSLDFNSDGYQDLYVVNGSGFTNSYGNKPWWYDDSSARGALFENDGTGHFANVTQAAGLSAAAVGMGCAVGDYDNDGHPDLYLTQIGHNRLFRNLGDGHFQDVSASAGIIPSHLTEWHTSAVWFDFDHDGLLDLYSVGFIQFDKYLNPAEKNSFFEPVTPTFLDPTLYDAAPNRLYRNNGNGTFTDVTLTAGAADAAGRGLNAVAVDLNADGRVDLYVANEKSRNTLLLNNDDGTFTDVSEASGGALMGNGPVVAGDYDGDGRTDLYLAPRPKEPARLLRNLVPNNQLPRLIDIAPERFGALSGFGHHGWGAAFIDHNSDGQMDLFVSHGGAAADFDDPLTSIGQPDLLFTQTADGKFRQSALGTRQTGGWQRSGRGVTIADLNNDGRAEIIVNNNNQKPFILARHGASQHHWIGVRLIGTTSNRDAVGATVGLYTQHGHTTHPVGGAGFLSQSQAPLVVGLAGDATRVTIQVDWPSGTRQRFEAVPANQFVTISEAITQLAEATPPTRQRPAPPVALPDWPVEVAAAVVRAAANLPPERAQPSVRATLADPRPSVRLEAVRGLTVLNHTTRLNDLSHMRFDPSAEVRQAVATAIGNAATSDATELLIPLTVDPVAAVRTTSIGVIGQLFMAEHAILKKTMLRKRGAVIPLINAMTDPEPTVRKQAALALGATESYRAIGPVMTLLTDADNGVRRAAAKALGQLRDNRAIGPLLSAANAPHESPYVRAEALLALARMGNSNGFGSLLEDLLAPDTLRQNQALAVVDAVLANRESIRLDRSRLVRPLLGLVATAPLEIAHRALAALRATGADRIGNDLLALPPTRQQQLGAPFIATLLAVGAEAGTTRLVNGINQALPTWWRRDLVRQLGRTRPTPATINLLSNLALDDDEPALIRGAALRALRTVDPALWPVNLAQSCLNAPAGARLFAVDLLAVTPASHPSLTQVMDTAVPDALRIRAIRLAAQTHLLTAVPTLIRIAKGRGHSTYVRRAAIAALGTLADPRAAIHLRALAQLGPTALRVAASQSLSAFTDMQSRRLLKEIGENPLTDVSIRVAAINALGRLQDDVLLSWLQPRHKSDPE